MDRGVSPVIGVVILLATTVLLASVVGVVVTTRPAVPPPTASFEVSADADTNRITLTHRGGDPINVNEISISVNIGGEPLDTQPQVPFFAAQGFGAGPTGPFNIASEDTWQAGERTTFRVAGTNRPQLTAGESVTVTLATETAVIAEVETTIVR
jgi:flagellin-like protein